MRIRRHTSVAAARRLPTRHLVPGPRSGQAHRGRSSHKQASTVQLSNRRIRVLQRGSPAAPILSELDSRTPPNTRSETVPWFPAAATEIVEANHQPALLQERAGEMELDKLGSAGHENWIHELASGVLLVSRWYGFQRSQG